MRASVHTLPEEWLRARVRGWLTQENEYKTGLNGSATIKTAGWWGCTFTAEGKFLEVDGGDEPYHPSLLEYDLARRVCRFVNRECNHGGAWIVAWCLGGKRFYLVWKDNDGDFQVPIECDLPLHRYLGWSMNDWAEHASQAYSVWCEWHAQMEYTNGQQVKLAQGEKSSDPTVI